MSDVTIVMATRDRRESVLHTLDRLAELPERPPVIVVDNASTDGTADAVAAVAGGRPGLSVVRLPRNRGAAARNVGVARARTPYIAFADDDSWWRPGALARAVAHFGAAPRLAVLAARILVGEQERLDPVCRLMAESPLRREPDLPGPPVRGFVACGALVRRSAFLGAGGFSDLLFFLGEEADLLWRLLGLGWAAAYLDDVVAVHHPDRVTRRSDVRQRLHARNRLLTAWLHRPVRVALADTAALARRAAYDESAPGALLDAARRWPDVVARRRRLPCAVEADLRMLAASAT